MAALEISTPVLRTRVAQGMVAALVVVDEYFSSAVAVTTVAAFVGPLGLFGVVVEGALEGVDQLITQVEAGLDEGGFDLLEGDLQDIVTEVEYHRALRADLEDALHVCQHLGRRLRLIGIGVHFVEVHLALLDDIFFVPFHNPES